MKGRNQRDYRVLIKKFQMCFRNSIDQCRNAYQLAQGAVELEDKRLQDLLHELEFAENVNEKRRSGTKLQQSRRERRRQKDEVKRLRLLIEFFNDPANKSTLNKMRQLLGRQRKEEEFLNGDRIYKPRVTKQTKE